RRRQRGLRQQLDPVPAVRRDAVHPVLMALRVPVLDWIVQVQAYPLAHLVALLVLVGVTFRRYGRDVGPAAEVLDPLLAGIVAGMLGARLLADWTSGHTLVDPLAAPRGWWAGARS